MAELLVISREEVAAHLDYEACIPLMREAMIALSRGETRQLLRAIIDLNGGRAFGTMPGAMDEGSFGAKLISVFPGAGAQTPSHQGVIALFDPKSGAPCAIVDAGEVTAIRTAAASAAATDALARRDSRSLAILGTGEQACRHALAIPKVREIEEIVLWGRSAAKARALAARLREELGMPATAADTAEDAVREADIICTTTASPEPVLLGAWVKPGTHVNLVGSSRAGPVEVDSAFVAGARFFADHREGVLRQGAEFLRAVKEGAIEQSHLLGEIGEVFAGTLEGRASPDDVTAYKSLGSIVQDLTAGWHLYREALCAGFGTRVGL